MITLARAKFMRVSPTKVRQVIDLIRGQDVLTPQAILTHVQKGSRQMISKVLNSAVDNAK